MVHSAGETPGIADDSMQLTDSVRTEQFALEDEDFITRRRAELLMKNDPTFRARILGIEPCGPDSFDEI